MKVSAGGAELPSATLVTASTADRRAKGSGFKLLCSYRYCSPRRGELDPYLLIAVGDVPDLIPREGDFGGQPVVWVVNVETQGVNSKEQFRALFILKGGKTRAEDPFIRLRDDLTRTKPLLASRTSPEQRPTSTAH